MLGALLFAVGAGGLAYGISKLPDDDGSGSSSSSGTPPKDGESAQEAYARGVEEQKATSAKSLDKKSDAKAKGLFDSWKADFLEKQLKGDSDGD